MTSDSEYFEQKYEQPLSERFYIRVTPKQKKLLRKAAEIMDMQMSDFCREIIEEIAPMIIKKKES